MPLRTLLLKCATPSNKQMASIQEPWAIGRRRKQTLGHLTSPVHIQAPLDGPTNIYRYSKQLEFTINDGNKQKRFEPDCSGRRDYIYPKRFQARGANWAFS